MVKEQNYGYSFSPFRSPKFSVFRFHLSVRQSFPFYVFTFPFYSNAPILSMFTSSWVRKRQSPRFTFFLVRPAK